MKCVDLVRIDPAIEASLVNDSSYRDAMAQGDWARVASLVHQWVGRTLPAAPLSVDKLEWGGYFAVDIETREVVGSCAFKGAPTEEGAVEIAYFTYPGFEGKGYATSMARQLIEWASGCMAVERVIAHTLPEANASTRVLEKIAMSFVGEVVDPEDGRVWQWQMRCHSRPAASVRR